MILLDRWYFEDLEQLPGIPHYFDETFFSSSMSRRSFALGAATFVTVISILVATGYHVPVLMLLMRVGWATGIMPQLVLKKFLAPDDGPSFYFLRRAMSDSWYQNKVLKWTPRNEDIVLATFPKSGTHLMAQLLVQTTTDGEEFDTIHHKMLVPEMEKLDPEACGDAKLLTLENYQTLLRANKPGVIVTHLPPAAVRHGKGKYVVMIRNPLDTLVSMHSQFSRILGAGAPPWNKYLTIYL